MTLHEHSITLDLTMPEGDVHAGMEIFYNPVMISNRNISIALLQARNKTDQRICDPLAGSGIRSARFLKELPQEIIKELIINDVKPDFEKNFKDLCQKNNIQLNQSQVIIHSTDANQLILTEKGFDYIEIDPFGTPNPFLSAAINKITRGGILAITATDTAALTGTYPKVTKRKYWAKSLKNYSMHETGLRILIRKIQLLGIQFDKCLTPILSYHKEHYFRIYFESSKGKEKCDAIIQEHQYFLWCRTCLTHTTSQSNTKTCCQKEMEYAGPLYTGLIQNQTLLSTMVEQNKFPEEKDFLQRIEGEAKQDIGFYDVHELARTLKIDPPRLDLILKATQGVRTHFSDTGIKTNIPLEEIKKKILSINTNNQQE